MAEPVYTEMESILIEGVKKLTTKEVVEAALKTKQKLADTLTLDLLLLEMERQQDMMDGRKMEEWIL